MQKPKQAKKAIKKSKKVLSKTKFSQLGFRKRLNRFKKLKGFESLACIADKPLKFKTSNGSKVIVLRHGFSNIYKGQQNVPARALVLAFVNGKKLFFYRSSGEESGKQGQWFPTQGPVIHSEKGTKYLGWMTKMKGHPEQRGLKGNPKTMQEMKKFRKRSYFPKQTSEIIAGIKRMENRLELHSEWSASHYLLIANAFEKLPFTDEISLA